MNLDKLDAAIAHIEAKPQEWNQEHWFSKGDGGCGTAACLAGTIALLDGWVPDGWEPWQEWDEDSGDYYTVGQETGYAVKDGERLPVQIIAALAIGLGEPWTNSFSSFDIHPMFAFGNDLDDIREHRDALAASGEAGERSDTQKDLGGSS
jgi:hypothetical protein